MKRLSLGILIGSILLITSSVLLIGIIRSHDSNLVITPPKNQQSVKISSSETNKPAISGEPVALSIPSLNLNLPVIPGYYDAKNQTWTLTTNKVQYAVITPEPNNISGNTFIYGHDRSNLFASLHTIKPNAEATVTTDNGHTFYYQLSSVRVVNPNDSASVFNYQGSPILTLQTCTGLFYQNRQLFTFNLERVV